jgi:putative ABC transport system substrate-binding protein
MSICLGRREFIAGLGGAVGWPLAAGAQRPTTPVVGFLRSASESDSAQWVAAFRRGLTETRWIEGHNVTIDFRFADGNLDRLPALVSDLIRAKVGVIVANQQSTPAAMAATTTIAIVFDTGGDPLRQGLVASLNRPVGNVTGVSFLNGSLGGKRMGLLQLAPKGAVGSERTDK